MKPLNQLFRAEQPVIEKRCVHLDLKGTPPAPTRLIRLLEVFAAAHYNAVLVEWEDSFPWTVDERFRSETAYSPDTVRKFIKTADRLGIEVIPLVQCLGHMETPLRLQDYAHLREVPHDEFVLNPLASGARDLIWKMINDVLTLMPEVQRFHLGGDEVWSFGTHPDTKKYVARHGKEALYLHHVEPLFDKLNKRRIRPLLWHDMMNDWDSAALKRLARKADLVIWGYRGHPDTNPGHYRKEIIERFVKHRMPLWGATAYKGAHDGNGSDIDLPDIARREENASGWVEVARRYGFIGLIATGWSRYSTNNFQNEPIDGALDSAFNVGVILHDGQPPQGGIKACLKALNQIGESRTFRRVKATLTNLTRVRDNGWSNVQNLRQLIVTVTQDSRRLPCFEMVKQLSDMQNALQYADTVSDDLRKALTGLIEPIWIERYIAERIEPLREEFLSLKARVRQITPGAYAALFQKR